MSVALVDTSIFCEILDVPRLAGQRSTIVAEMKAKLVRKEQLLLPMTTILETGNHIGQNGNGAQRRQTAQRFVEAVRDAVSGNAPFTPTQFVDAERLLPCLADFADWVGRESGLGDLTIFKEWETVCARFPTRRVYVWSLDRHLASYDRRP
jgi:hypothetical protein